jgi:cytochrome c-type biogenesis protein CcmH
MIAFVTLAVLLVLAALLFVLWPLLRAPRAAATTQAANLDVYRDQFAELERDVRLGTIDAKQYDVAVAELQRRLLDEAGQDGQVRQAGPARASRITAAAIALLIPVTAGLLYWHLGEPQALDPAQHAEADASSITQEQFEAMTEQLAARMAANPDDAEGWAMLGRAYKALGRYPDAAKALAEANQRRPGVPELLVEYAEALAQVHGKLAGEPRRLLEQALKIAPNDPKALTLAGGAAFEAGDYRQAIRHWQTVAAGVPADSELGKALATGIERAQAMSGGKPAVAPSQPAAADVAAPVVRGEIRLAAALKERAAADDTVFIFARAAEGPRMPLAVLRKQVRDLPATFQLDDSMAMNPALKLSSVPRVVVTARVSRTGGATPQSGDLQGESQPVAPGARPVSITIDKVLP